MTNTLHSVQYQCSMDRYVNDHKACTDDNSDDLASWLLSVEKVAKLMDNGPRTYVLLNWEAVYLNFYIH